MLTVEERCALSDVIDRAVIRQNELDHVLAGDESVSVQWRLPRLESAYDDLLLIDRIRNADPTDFGDRLLLYMRALDALRGNHASFVELLWREYGRRSS